MTLSGTWDRLLSTLGSIWADTVSHLPAMVAAVFVVLATWAAATVGTRLLESYLDRRNLRRSVRDLIMRFALMSVWVVGLMISAMLLFPGLTPTKALGVLGLGSVAIGFAFKDIFENFLAGVMVLWRFPFEIGDTIQCEGIVGRVKRITIRNTMIELPTDELVILPNSTLFKNPLKVLTESKFRRIDTTVGVAYDVDVKAAIQEIGGALSGCQSVSQEHEPQIFVTGFGASSVDIQIAWWAESTLLEERSSRSEVCRAVKRAFDTANIEIPFPYRTLTFKEPLSIEEPARTSDA